MAKNWNAQVYRTDVKPEEYVGFFLDDKAAKTWVKQQKEGTFKVSTDRPRKRTVATEEAANV